MCYSRYINWTYPFEEEVDQINVAVFKLSIGLGPPFVLEGEQVPAIWVGINIMWERLNITLS